MLEGQNCQISSLTAHAKAKHSHTRLIGSKRLAGLPWTAIIRLALTRKRIHSPTPKGQMTKVLEYPVNYAGGST